tara:strand:- start:15968 stop:16297 length:330 start_codon:yes stop_codon:yes gene_type:complete
MFIVKTRIYLHNKEYKRIVILTGNFDKNIKTLFLSDKQLSVFSGTRQYDCIHAVLSLRNNYELMIDDEIPDFLCHLVELGHTIDTNITQMYSSNQKINKSRENIICFVK